MPCTYCGGVVTDAAEALILWFETMGAPSSGIMSWRTLWLRSKNPPTCRRVRGVHFGLAGFAFVSCRIRGEAPLLSPQKRPVGGSWGVWTLAAPHTGCLLATTQWLPARKPPTGTWGKLTET